MAVPQIQRLAQMVRRSFSIKESYDQSVLEDVFPSFELGGPTAADLRRPRGERLWCFFSVIAASIGNTGTILLRAVPGKLTVVEGLVFTSTSGLIIAPTTLAFAGAQVKVVPMDGRDDATGQSMSTMFEQRTNIGVSVNGLQLPNASQVPFVIPWVLLGDAGGSGFASLKNASSGLVFQTASINTGMTLSAWGYEREIEPSEVI